MSSNSQKHLSKFLSYVLRHHPEDIGLELDEYGRARVDELVRKARNQGREISRDKVEELIGFQHKNRFILSDNRQYIRAGYGHSIDVKLMSEPSTPPNVLYHGTARRNLGSIEERGLHPGSRNFVHLSGTPEDARSVGSRHGKPVVFKVLARRMYENGFLFYQSESEAGIWLTEKVPPEFIRRKK